jgi:hypothetical protein
VKGASLLVAALLLCGASAPAAADRRAPLDSVRYESAWERVQSCSGRLPIPGHALAQLVVIPESLVSIGGHRVFARWVPGDTMFITQGLPDTGWVVRHELLHLLLQGPTPPSDPHPMEPFAFPCHLLQIQQGTP